MEPSLETRRATVEDLDAVLHQTRIGLATFVEFEPSGWEPPERPDERGRTAELLTDRHTWAMVAVYAGEPVGHVGFIPARERPAGAGFGGWRTWPRIRGLAHLWHLFVLPEWWGRGAAPLLHDAVVAEMRRQGYRHARLLTPSRNARARRFYERRGWSAQLDTWSEDLKLALTEYRLALGPAPAPSARPSDSGCG